MPIPRLTKRQLSLINFKLAADNNAMLRIMLENQLKILDTLGVSDANTRFSFESVFLNSEPSSRDNLSLEELSRSEYESNIVASNVIARQVIKRSIDWVRHEDGGKRIRLLKRVAREI